MGEVIRPQTAEQVRDAVRWAAEHGEPLEVRGCGTKAGLGRVTETETVLDLSGLDGVTLYEPEELVATARAGTRLAALTEMLGAKGQMLAFEPPDFGPLFGHAVDGGSLGGALAANLAGPRRFKAGAARDHILGVRLVTGYGDLIKSGGRVVKNVTGYDLSKLMAGSFGTLGALTEVSVKVLPRAESEVTLAWFGLDLAAGAGLLRAAAMSPAEPTGLAFLPDGVADRAPLPEAAGGVSATLVRLEGAQAALAARADALCAPLGVTGGVRRLERDASMAAWRAVRDVAPLAPPADLPLWRVTLPPTDIVDVIENAQPAFHLIDWGGGLAWLSAPEPPVLARGAAMLFRGDEETRRRLPFLPAQPEALAALTRRVKASFDPKDLLNPGRMYEGV